MVLGKLTLGVQLTGLLTLTTQGLFPPAVIICKMTERVQTAFKAQFYALISFNSHNNPFYRGEIREIKR